MSVPEHQAEPADQTVPTVPVHQPESTNTPRARLPRVAIAAVIAIVVATAVVSTIVIATLLGRGPITALAQSKAETPLAEATTACGVSPLAAVLGDNGNSLSLNRVAAKENPEMTYRDYECILKELDTPDAVLARLGHTRALDGTQNAAWGQFSATWTYHPDDGINMVIEIAP